MLRKNLDPRDILSLVEGEMSGDEARELEKRIQESPENTGYRALYEDLKRSVSALRSLPQRDAPESVWNRLEASFQETVEETLRMPVAPRGRLRRLWRPTIAAACLLVAISTGVLFLLFRTPGPGSPKSPIRWIAKVPSPAQGPTRGKETVLSVITEFMFKDPIRYRGVSRDILDISNIPATDPSADNPSADNPSADNPSADNNSSDR